MTIDLEINEKRSCIVSKIYFKDLFLTIENGDEDIALSQIVSKEIPFISIDIDDKRRYIFRSTIVIGFTDNVIKQIFDNIE
jgi:hypothetical protein